MAHNNSNFTDLAVVRSRHDSYGARTYQDAVTVYN